MVPIVQALLKGNMEARLIFIFDLTKYKRNSYINIVEYQYLLDFLSVAINEVL